MANGILRVQGDKVVDGNGNPVYLRGASLGGWMKYAHAFNEAGRQGNGL